MWRRRSALARRSGASRRDPLVNVVLAPDLGAAWLLSHAAGWGEAMPNAYTFIQTIFIINCVLLCFNLLPVYPLDGGQILQSLLWFIFGRARSTVSHYWPVAVRGMR